MRRQVGDSTELSGLPESLKRIWTNEKAVIEGLESFYPSKM